MGKLILIRHGESVWNTRSIFTGWIDIPLTQSGIIEAAKAGNVIAGIDIDVVYTSALVRAMQTSLIVLLGAQQKRTPYMIHGLFDRHHTRYHKINKEIADNMIPVYRCWQLNERYYGDLQGYSKSRIAELFGVEKVLNWRRGYNARPPKGESLHQTARRTMPFFNRTIMAQLRAGKNVLISAHSNSLRSIIMHLDNLTEEQVVGLEIDTANPIVYNFDGKNMEREHLNVTRPI